MLSPQYLERMPEELVRLYSAVELDIIADMARRIVTYDYWIPAAEWQAQKLMAMGVVEADILKALSVATGRNIGELRQMMQEAGVEALRNDVKIYEHAGIDTTGWTKSPKVNNVLNAGFKQTAGTLTNITRTTAHTATGQFERILDRIWMQVNTGAFDYNTAIRNGVKTLAGEGIHVVEYPSGHADTIEVAVRRAAVTGVNQTAAKCQIALAEELGCDLVEVTAHSGARPSHAAWQGKVYSLSGKTPGYRKLSAATGYGTGAGLCGWNCRHNFNPYVEGTPRTYTQKQLTDLDAKTVEYNGKMYTEYEASQIQRGIERKIRRWKREDAAMSAAGLDNSEARAKVRDAQAQMRDFIGQTDFKRQSAREQIAK